METMETTRVVMWNKFRYIHIFLFLYIYFYV